MPRILGSSVKVWLTLRQRKILTGWPFISGFSYDLRYSLALAEIWLSILHNLFRSTGYP